jgi:hypothetical protein
MNSASKTAMFKKSFEKSGKRGGERLQLSAGGDSVATQQGPRRKIDFEQSKVERKESTGGTKGQVKNPDHDEAVIYDSATDRYKSNLSSMEHKKSDRRVRLNERYLMNEAYVMDHGLVDSKWAREPKVPLTVETRLSFLKTEVKASLTIGQTLRLKMIMAGLVAGVAITVDELPIVNANKSLIDNKKRSPCFCGWLHEVGLECLMMMTLMDEEREAGRVKFFGCSCRRNHKSFNHCRLCVEIAAGLAKDIVHCDSKDTYTQVFSSKSVYDAGLEKLSKEPNATVYATANDEEFEEFEDGVEEDN